MMYESKSLQQPAASNSRHWIIATIGQLLSAQLIHLGALICTVLHFECPQHWPKQGMSKHVRCWPPCFACWWALG
jgi:hypothetical protein